MTLEPKIVLRLQFLARVVRKECKHLTATDQRLFGGLFTLEQAAFIKHAKIAMNAAMAKVALFRVINMIPVVFQKNRT